jgi:hypothetical protein
LLKVPDLDAALKTIVMDRADILARLSSLPPPKSKEERTKVGQLAGALGTQNAALSEALRAMTKYLAEVNKKS